MRPTATISRRGADRLRAGHPWIYRSDVVAAEAEPGDLVEVRTERGRPLGRAYFSSQSQITLRLVARAGEDEWADDTALFDERLAAAEAYRASLAIDASAYRLVNGESDRLPATIVDRYADESGVYFVVQTLAQGADRRLDLLVERLVARYAPQGVLERNDPRVRALEGLESRVSVRYGQVPERVRVREGEVTFAADLHTGQKTGLFLDQRENHAAAARYARGRSLDAFTYNGGFALAMARAADEVIALDASAAAVAQTRENAAANGLTNVEAREANVFDALRELEIAGAAFDTIALDPPAFAKHKGAVGRALAGYKEINLRALRLLTPGGHLITCSCSYNVDETLFAEAIRAAAADVGATVALVEKRMQARDHPVLVGVPETYYLKCFVLRKVA